MQTILLQVLHVISVLFLSLGPVAGAHDVVALEVVRVKREHLGVTGGEVDDRGILVLFRDVSVGPDAAAAVETRWQMVHAATFLVFLLVVAELVVVGQGGEGVADARVFFGDPSRIE